jgi:hypothetical protein
MPQAMRWHLIPARPIADAVPFARTDRLVGCHDGQVEEIGVAYVFQVDIEQGS